jgi:hypothetical protein
MNEVMTGVAADEVCATILAVFRVCVTPDGVVSATAPDDVCACGSDNVVWPSSADDRGRLAEAKGGAA